MTFSNANGEAGMKPALFNTENMGHEFLRIGPTQLNTNKDLASS